MKQVMVLFVTVLASPAFATVSDTALEASRQCVVVTTNSWSAGQGTLATFARESVSTPWKLQRSGIPVVVGRAGLAWAPGYPPLGEGLRKSEGDKKAPAGIFALRSVFGYGKNADTRMPYLQVTPETVCVDDPRSAQYNKLVDKTAVPVDWHSAEEMRRRDALYKWGVFVDYNKRLGQKIESGAGSCIFLHIWRGADRPTVGCTAMAEKNLVNLIHWLDPARAPVLVQLPRTIYEDERTTWKLPPLP